MRLLRAPASVALLAHSLLGADLHGPALTGATCAVAHRLATTGSSSPRWTTGSSWTRRWAAQLTSPGPSPRMPCAAARPAAPATDILLPAGFDLAVAHCRPPPQVRHDVLKADTYF